MPLPAGWKAAACEDVESAHRIKTQHAMLAVGFEPTRPRPCELESHPLDHSGILAVAHRFY